MHKLNAITVPDRYPIPHIHNFAIGIQGIKVFTNFDLVKSYYQIPVAEEDTQKRTPFGLYKFMKTPFSLQNMPITDS